MRGGNKLVTGEAAPGGDFERGAGIEGADFDDGAGRLAPGEEKEVQKQFAASGFSAVVVCIRGGHGREVIPVYGGGKTGFSAGAGVTAPGGWIIP
jgi:hypothetical protein